MVTDEKFGIFKGELAKYQLTITREDFDVQTCDFSIRLSWGMFGQYIEIPKSEMYRDEEWHMFFVFDTSDMMGPIKATTTYYVADTDLADNMRECTDMQVIGFVVDSECSLMQARCKNNQTMRFVEFDRIARSDAQTLFANLLTVDGRPVTSVDGKHFKVRKSNLM
jgi:hypothetical protein